MSQGRIRIHFLAQSNMDKYTGTDDPVLRKSIVDHVGTMGVFSPYFDDKLWFPHARAYPYHDIYAIYTNDSLATEHPDWILKGASGQSLYIPSENASGQLTEYAGDFSNPAFRAHQIAKLVSFTDAGYGGVWLDDVNLAVRCTDGTRDANGALMSVLPAGWDENLWAHHMSDFTHLIRVSLPPDTAITHNALWMPSFTNYVKTQAVSCDNYYLERGYSGVTHGGSDQWGFAAFMRYIDQIHGLGTSVILGDYHESTMEYSVAGYLLTNNGYDSIGFSDQTLSAPWPNLLNLDLGQATAPHSKKGNLWFRSFSRGSVYLNEPGAPSTTMTLQRPAYDTSGNEIASINLGPAQAKIVLFESDGGINQAV